MGRKSSQENKGCSFLFLKFSRILADKTTLEETWCCLVHNWRDLFFEPSQQSLQTGTKSGWHLIPLRSFTDTSKMIHCLDTSSPSCTVSINMWRFFSPFCKLPLLTSFGGPRKTHLWSPIAFNVRIIPKTQQRNSFITDPLTDHTRKLPLAAKAHWASCEDQARTWIQTQFCHCLVEVSVSHVSLQTQTIPTNLENTHGSR